MWLPLQHPRFWWNARRRGTRISSSAIVRGAHRISLARACRIARGAELNAGNGRIALGTEVVLGPYTIIEARSGQVAIGARTKIGPFCVLYGHGGLTIGADCLIASHVVCIPENHCFTCKDRPISAQGATRRGIVIGDDVWLATGVTILDGVRIGNGAVIGAGAVVTKDIPAYGVAVGVPARIIAQRGE